MRLRHLSIKSKLTLIATLASSVALLVASLGFFVYDLVSFRGLLSHDLLIQAQIIGRNSNAAVSFEDATAAGEALNALAVRRDVLDAGILLPDGRLLARYRRDPGPAPPRPELPPGAGSSVRAGRLLVRQPIEYRGERLGTLYIQSDLSLWYARLKRYSALVALLMLAAAGVALVLASRLQRVISQPILSLGEAMQRVSAQRDYGLRAAKSSQDEIGSLIDGFNAMLAEIQARDATLERRVAERSAAAELRAHELARTSEALQAQTRLLQSILQSMGDGVLVCDASGRIAMGNPAAEAILARRLDGLLLSEWLASGRLLRPDGATAYEAQDLPLARAMAGQAVDAAEIYVEGPSGPRWLSMSARPILQDGPQAQSHPAVAVFRDVTEQRRAREALRESEERYALAVRGANDGIWDWDLRAGRLYLSPRWKQMLGYAEHELGELPEEWLGRLHPEDRPRVEAELGGHLEGRTPLFESEHQVRHKDGRYLWVLTRGLAVRDPEGRALRMAGSQADVAAGKVADLLTGLPNRVLFMDRIQRALNRARRRPGSYVGVLFVDLDRFKLINDSLGHVAGDELLVGIARRLEGCLRSGDSLGRLSDGHTVARMGGDEFTVLLEEIRDVTDATRVAERITQALAQPFQLSGNEVFVTASVGIALSPADGDGAEELLRNADTAMYRAKTLGKARYEVFDAEMRERAIRRLQGETELRKALDNHELRVHYQPITELRGGRIVGFEALVRWQHPQRGLIGPTEFVPLAEETGLIVPMGQWVLYEACRQMAAWRERFGDGPPRSVSVNLSSRQFVQQDLLDSIREVLADTRLPPEQLRLEITESLIMEDPEATARLLRRLRDLRVQAYIDDFGTGYSSLSYLHRFPVSTLKVDRSFVGSMSHDGKGEGSAIVHTIVSLAHNLGLKVVAEGVESQDQLARLRELRCEYGQGFLFSRAVDGPAAAALVAAEAAGPSGS